MCIASHTKMDPNWVTKDELEDEALTYVQDKGVGPLLEGLMKEIIVAKPDDPISFLIDRLKGGYAVLGAGGWFYWCALSGGCCAWLGR